VTSNNSKIRARSLYFEGPKIVSIRETLIERPESGDVLVETVLSAISSGTEFLVYRGEWPEELTVDDSISSLSGTFSYPLKYGYASVGRITQIGSNVSPNLLGKLVFSFNPHETHFVSAADRLIVLPENLTPEAACFLPNMETAVSLVMDGRPLIGETVAVFGQGVVGLLTTALLAQMSLGKLVTFDRHPLRRQASLALGAGKCLDSSEEFTTAKFEQSLQCPTSEDSSADLTYELTGRPDVLNEAISITGFSGRIVVGSFYGSKKAEIELGRWFHRSRIKIISSQVSSIDPRLSGRWSKSRRLDLALRMIAEIKPERLITHKINFSDAKRAYEILDKQPEEAIQVIITYGENS
jgi:2-desacetyl-2-hydroxyethyl bacteriochlorophyllide A dehydrogenase